MLYTILFLVLAGSEHNLRYNSVLLLESSLSVARFLALSFSGIGPLLDKFLCQSRPVDCVSYHLLRII
jgi:hypothetical protein